MPVEALSDRALVHVGGEDAADFLNNLVTCDVARAKADMALFGSLLSPQGKVLFEFFIIRRPDGFWLEIDRDQRAELVRRLAFYRLRAKVTIEPVEGLWVHAVWGASALPHDAVCARDSRHADLGWRVICNEDGQPDDADGETGGAYNALCVRLGIPQGGVDYSFGDAFPHEVLYDQIGAVDFAKGCYVGQEVVSRMQHRANVRKRVVKVAGKLPLPATGHDIVVDGRRIGHLGSVSGNEGLAMARLDKAKQAIDQGEAITAEGVELTITLPDWVTFGWPHATSRQSGN